jgi:hypothetical protein
VFEDLVMAGMPTCAGKRVLPSGQLDVAVASDPAAIGFVGAADAKAARVMPIGDRTSRALGPTLSNVAAGAYPLAQRLYLYAAPHPAGPEASDFLKYASSEQGHAVLRAGGAIEAAKPSRSSSANGSRDGARGLAGARAHVASQSADAADGPASRPAAVTGESPAPSTPSPAPPATP